MEPPNLLTSRNASGDTNNSGNVPNVPNVSKSPTDEYTDLQERAIANFQKPNLPNINVPERIIICLDICYDNQNSLYRLGDGTTFTPMNMMKRVLEFFIYTKHAISRRSEFALIVLKDTEPCWVQNFTCNLKDILSAIDNIDPEECISESFDFRKIFQLVKQKVAIPEYKHGDSILPPRYVVRMIVMYGRSNCIPFILQDDPSFAYLKKQLYFYVDILLAHEEDCALNKCEEIYDSLQDLDNGYSYVFEVSRNAVKIHDYIAKLLAHPLQRPLQKNTDYSFGTRY